MGGVIINIATAGRNTQSKWTVGPVLGLALVSHDKVGGGLCVGGFFAY